jgi:hypothetical protein
MAKISAALGRLDRAGVPYISVLTDPTTGGVTQASPCWAISTSRAKALSASPVRVSSRRQFGSGSAWVSTQ